MATRSKMGFAVMLLGVAIAQPASASPITDPVVEDNRLSVNVDFGTVSTELSIEFEKAVGLSLDNLGLSAELVDPLDPALVSRLTDSLNISLTGGLPILVRIQPPVDGGLSFEGIANIELYTHDLQYTAGTPLRLFSSPDGGIFRDITAQMSSGSYRVRGSKGNFSEFLIVADLRTIASVIDGKFGRLSDLLYGYAGKIDSTLFSSLESDVAAAQAAWNNGDLVTAIAKVEEFASRVRAADGGAISRVWRSSRDLDNVAGELRAVASTLRFSLTLASNSL